MTKYGIIGMSCSACSARIEKVVGRIEGVTSVSVSLLTNSMIVEGDVDSSVIIEAVRNAGFGASLTADLTDRESPVLRKRLITSIGFLVVLMYLSMGYGMLRLPLPSVLNKQYLLLALLQMLLATAIIIINRKFFVNGYKGIVKRAPNMDTLVALGVTASCVWSLFTMVLMALSEISGTTGKTAEYYHDLYFESAGMILTLITVGKLLEALSRGRTTDAIKSLINLTPKQARVLYPAVDAVSGETDSGETAGEIEKMVDITQVKPGDIFIVKSGESIPVDGVIVSGNGSVDESMLTGESIPVDAGTDDKVYAATILKTGYLKCKATAVGADTTLSRIVSMVAEASATKAPIARIADRVAGVFVPTVIGIAVVTFIVWVLTGQDISFAISRAISVLVISCPCALGLATPVAIMVGSGVGARNNILFKTAESLENLGKIKTVALDKTGTITAGKPVVTDIYVPKWSDETELTGIAYALENKSEHPLSRAVIEYFTDTVLKNSKLKDYDLKDYEVIPGRGISAVLTDKDETVYAGNFVYIQSVCKSDKERISEIETRVGEYALQGKTPLVFSSGTEILGIIAVADEIKSDSARAIETMKKLGINVVMLTGDNKVTAKAIAERAGIDSENIIAEIMPQQKAEKISALSDKGMVAMVGDGINDAPALTVADIGIAVGAGAEIAIESADVVLMKDSLKDVVNAIKLSRATLRNIKQNLFWAFFYNIVCIPLAAGVYYPLFGLTLNPMIGALAMSLSSICVVTNACRLNYIKFKE